MSEASALRAAAAWLAGPVSLTPLGAGHINDTWLVQATAGRFVLQRLNAAVFPRPDLVAASVARVVQHLAGKPRVRVPALCRSGAGAHWHEDSRGAIWRLWEYVAEARAPERLRSPAEAVAAGAAFGRFQLALRDLPGPVPDPIPGFLRLARYLRELDATVTAGLPGGAAAGLLERVERRRWLADCFVGTDRLIHGDCKIDNLLFHPHRAEVLAIIDLDTVMSGHWGWDFGDLVRSAAADGERVSVERFAAIARGFLRSGALQDSGAGPELADDLVLAPRYVTLMLGVRFLTDHLRGDRYFKVSARGDNLSRAARQLALLEDMERREPALKAAARSA